MTARELPNRFEHAEACARLYAFWEQHNLFHAEPDPQQTPYSIVIPPPNVTGALHLGHALNNTLQDIQIRLRRMQGYNTLWMPGTDHAGIATQAVVERRLKEDEGKTRHDLGREALVERIWEWKNEYEVRILNQLKRLGCSCDWQRTRFTLDPDYGLAVRYTFFDLFRKQLIFRGKRLVNWDTFLQTAVSDDEVFTEKTAGNLWHFQYPVIDPQPGEPKHVTIATTRPETMLGDTAVAVHPDPAAALEKVRSELQTRLASAPAKEKPELQAQLDEIQRRSTELLPHLEQLRDMAQQGRRLRLPLLDREIPLVTDAWAKPEMGSGCVKITPAHDPNDYLVGQRCGLPMVNILNADGTLNAHAGPYQSLTIPDARRKVVADMEARGLLEKVEPHEIELPHSDRSKTPIEPYLADQWFVKMEQLAQDAMDAVTDERVRMVPQRYVKGYLDWLGEKRDWPVSRQLWWGHQIPVWSKPLRDAAESSQWQQRLDKDADVLAGRAAYQIEQSDDPARSGEAPRLVLHVCLRDDDAALEKRFEEEGFVREEDVLDTWFSSALWPHSTFGWPEQTPELKYYYPTSALITSRDIITLWVARMVITGLNNLHDVPFREVFIHPKILDGDGETMSKSKGNGIDPIDVIDKFGPDALRFGMAHLTTETQDVRMPVEFECPAPDCGTLIKQTRENRVRPKLKCPKCGNYFATQWAKTDEDRALPRAAVVSERFEQARNFCNKLWNASRFALLNLENYAAGPVADNDLAIEDRWMLSRLATVTRQVTAALEAYQFAEATRTLYSFAWDEFCSFYVEMLKDRLQQPQQRAVAQRVLAYALDVLLRLLHPITPFITEEVWQLLNAAAPERGLSPQPAAKSIVVAPWPQADERRIDVTIESRFAVFQATLGALREVRSRQNIPPRAEIDFRVRCAADTQTLLEPMSPYFARMANAKAAGFGTAIEAPVPNAVVTLPQLDVIVDLKNFIDVDAEIARLKKQQTDLQKMVESKQKKLQNANFVERAPADVVQRERDSLTQLEAQLASVQMSLDAMKGE